MLSKEVCKECFRKNDLIHIKYDEDRKRVGIKTLWSHKDDDNWNEKGVVMCRYLSNKKGLFKYVYINKVPEECPYALEHIVFDDARKRGI